jgi:hypothetical protein
MNKLNRLYEKVMKEKLRTVKVNYADGNSITTNMAAGLSDQEIKDYFKIGKKFNLGTGGKDKMVAVKSIKILESVHRESREADYKDFPAIAKKGFTVFGDLTTANMKVAGDKYKKATGKSSGNINNKIHFYSWMASYKESVYREATLNIGDIYKKDGQEFYVDEMHSGFVWVYNEKHDLKQIPRAEFNTLYKFVRKESLSTLDSMYEKVCRESLTKDKVIKYGSKFGNPSEVKKRVEKYYDYFVRVYNEDNDETPKNAWNVISSLSESVNREAITAGKYKTKGGEDITVHSVKDGKAVISGNDSKNKTMDVDALKNIIKESVHKEASYQIVQDGKIIKTVSGMSYFVDKNGFDDEDIDEIKKLGKGKKYNQGGRTDSFVKKLSESFKEAFKVGDKVKHIQNKRVGIVDKLHKDGKGILVKYSEDTDNSHGEKIWHVINNLQKESVSSKLLDLNKSSESEIKNSIFVKSLNAKATKQKALDFLINNKQYDKKEAQQIVNKYYTKSSESVSMKKTYDKAPANVKKIMDDLIDPDYIQLKNAAKTLNNLGYYMDYGLDANVTDFYKK